MSEPTHIRALLFTGSLLPVSLGIQCATVGAFSHVLGEVSNGNVLDSRMGRGVAERTMELPPTTWIYRVPLNLPMAAKIMAYNRAKLQEGKAYDGGWVIQWPFGQRRWLEDDRKWSCTELWAMAIPELNVGDLSRVVPQNLLTNSLNLFNEPMRPEVFYCRMPRVRTTRGGKS